MNALNNFEKSYTEYLLAAAENLIRFWRSNVKVTVHRSRQDGNNIHVSAGISKSIF